MRFLISRLSALGDTVCSLPAAVALKGRFPDCHITWVVDPRFAGIVECCSAVDEIYRYKPKVGQWPKIDGPFDVAMDLQGLAKSSLPVLFAKAKQKVGYHWQREGAGLASSAVLPDPTSFHVVDQYVDVARSVGAVADRAAFGLVPKQEDILSVRAKLKQNGISGRFVVLNAGAGWATKRWPATHFARLADLIHGEGVPCVLVGGGADADRAAAEEVTGRADNAPVNLLGQTSVRELVALIRLASAHIGGDTGSSHIAAALDVPAIGLYGITNPRRSCPYGQIERCHYEPLGLDRIRPEDVFESVRQVLAA
ncbi:MAG TPA: glycosyltransferase family 9 protein [Fimbriimonas sp.]|nr:glycosyltransferase family 9 protein [Fimbriimonas sp.]